tara:strand:+ start:16221 stop:16622 length:402 start_codon:yes stop_codon:yes gene_type:complete
MKAIGKYTLSEISFLLYIVSLVMPAFWFNDLLGFHCLILGWIGVFDLSFFGLAWLANPCYFIGLIISKNYPRQKLMFASLAILFSLFTFLIPEIPNDTSSASTKTAVGIGFALWFLSFLTLFIYTSPIKTEQN